MRILIANEALTGGGGVETYLATLVPALQARGHEVGVLHDNPAAEQGPQRIAPDGTWRAGVQDEGSPIRAIERVREFAPDVCFSHNMRRLEIDARLADAWPVVKMMHGHFGTCVSGQKAFGFPASAPCPRTFGPGCLAYYFPRRCGEASPSALVARYRWGLEQRALFPRYRSIVVASRYMRDEYLRAGAAEKSVHAIPLFAPPCTPDVPLVRARPVDVLFLGRLTALKGPDVLIEAAACAGHRLGRAVKIVMAGDGPLSGRLRELAGARGIDAAFPGWVDGEQRGRLLRDAAILAVPSRWQEPFGLVGLEAAAYGTPAVAFDTGGIRDWLQDDVNGRLVESRAGAEGMGAALAAILERPDLHARLSAAAREVAARFSVDGYVRALTSVLAGAAQRTAALQ
jgi:glycosyltransferase involved in cell wall biosynthesis